MASSAARSSPRDAQVMAQILKDAGIVEYEQRVINQMIEFAFRQVADSLDDAKVYSQHAGKKNIDVEDVKLAIQCRTDHYFTNPPPRDLLQEIARLKNSQPLPSIKPYGGPRLLPDRYCLTAPNFRTKTSKKPAQQPRIQFGLASQQRISLSSAPKGLVKSIGSTPGQPITMVSKPGASGSATAGQVTIISKPATLTAPKPTIRINTGPAAAGIGASGLAQLVTQSVPAVSGLAPTSLLSSASAPGPSVSVLGLSTPGSTITVNPLKRKLEDDDYDV